MERVEAQANARYRQPVDRNQQRSGAAVQKSEKKQIYEYESAERVGRYVKIIG